MIRRIFISILLVPVFLFMSGIPLEVNTANAATTKSSTVKKPVNKTIKKTTPTKKKVTVKKKKKSVNLNSPIITLETAPHSEKPAPKKAKKKTTTKKKA